jgi:hypothetical protein
MVALDPALVTRLGLDRPLPAAVRDAMAEDIQESHCHMLPAAMLDTMIAAQRARDAQIADRLAGAGTENGAVLITGTGHVRTDRAVPAYLARLVPAAPSVSIAFLEVRHDTTDPAAYAAGFGPGPFPLDYVWFTPRLEDTDPCEKFRVPLERLRRRE